MNTPVKTDEIVESLLDACKMVTDSYGGYCLTTYEILAERIKAHGIAPPDGYVLVPVEPTDKMIYIGGHVNSEWLNDNAPLGESRYQKPIKGIYKAMLSAVKEKE